MSNSQVVGMKNFLTSKPSDYIKLKKPSYHFKSDWVMHEYRLVQSDNLPVSEMVRFFGVIVVDFVSILWNGLFLN
jgi:hypothetical protein